MTAGSPPSSPPSVFSPPSVASPVFSPPSVASPVLASPVLASPVLAPVLPPSAGQPRSRLERPKTATALKSLRIFLTP
ncbi:MAG TPA: hypothetical protein DEA08_30850 [Planctomycetes bacterium]|nr:hypothetical protein [Planctomycetota bacterium]